jgi:ubiquinone/menaquinone biosynthesis C-methylase UbiE
VKSIGKPGDQQYDELYFDKAFFDFNVRYPFFRVIAAALLEKFNPDSVLDLGCGKGHLVYAFNQLNIDACGVDVASYAINQSPENIRPRLFRVDLAVGVLPFQDNTFDMVTSLGLIEHLEKPDHVICEIRRVLKPSGILFIRTPKRSTENALRLLGISDHTHVNVQSKAFWVKLFQREGFEYTGEFSPVKHRQAMQAQYYNQRAISRTSGYEKPTTSLGNALVKFSRAGKIIRREITCLLRLLPLETMFFQCLK